MQTSLRSINQRALLGTAFCLTILAGALSTASAAVVTPVATKYSSALSAARVPANLFNAAGMDGSETFLRNLDGSLGGEPTTADGVSWVTSSVGNEATAASEGRIWTVFDLGASYDLGDLDIWNFQWNLNGSTDLSDRGMSQIDVLVRDSEADTDDGTAGGTAINLSNAGFNNSVNDDAIFNLGASNQWQVALSNQALAQAPNNDTYTATTFSLAGNTARFIAIRADSYYGGGGVGLGKVRINSVEATAPEPSALVLTTIGVMGLAIRRRRRIR